ncbi:phage replication protein [Clostridium sartagoforme AAU1]|uniref:Phage replication protein n=1 Tax=Clostridium sartagoforme AAU1 TaxID=1202534 RepID=R9BUP6_9CLOT|nr:DnaD domain protein [Clostridium sartagoforme]EOR20410.1 phage replication protein [Clostridium sartagoforme AAU1]
MAIFRTVKNKNYSIMHNGFLTDNRLSMKAKGLLAYFLSKPDDWEFYSNEITKNCRDGKDSIATGIKELVNVGYIERFYKRNENGRFEGGYEYLVYETTSHKEKFFIEESTEAEKSKVENTVSELTKMDFANSENPPLLNTEYILSTEYKLNTKTPPPTEYKLNTDSHEKNNNIGTNKINKEEWWRSSNKDIYEFYINNGFGKINSVIIDVLDHNIKKYSKEAIKIAMIEAIKNNKYTLSYVEGILNKSKGKFRGKKGEFKIGDSTSSDEGHIREEGYILDIDDL